MNICELLMRVHNFLNIYHDKSIRCYMDLNLYVCILMINLSYPEAIEQITNKKFTITLEPPPPPPFMLGIKMQY